MFYHFSRLTLLIILISLNMTATSIAQKYGDCATSHEICKKQTYKYDKVGGEGSNLTEAEMVPCFINSSKLGEAELNSTWIKFEIEKGGSLGFTITPYDQNDDYDFVVYRLPSDGHCEKKQIVRCMASGETNGYNICMGSTGLRAGETDSSEDAGCADENDNTWLAPLKTSAREKYVILVSNVTKAGPGFSISFNGSAKLPCDEEKEKEKPKEKPVEKPAKTKPLVVEPTPVSEPIVVKPSETPNEITTAPLQLGNRAVEVKKDMVKVKSNKIRVTIWDDGIEDGDIVSIYVNEEKVLNKINLLKKPRIFDFSLPKGESEHFFTVFSDSFGDIEPNTATVKIEDGTRSYMIKLQSNRKSQESLKIIVE
jgi:hypothetical protein